MAKRINDAIIHIDDSIQLPFRRDFAIKGKDSAFYFRFDIDEDKNLKLVTVKSIANEQGRS